MVARIIISTASVEEMLVDIYGVGLRGRVDSTEICNVSMQALLSSMGRIEQRVIIERYGLTGKDGKTAQQISESLGLSVKAVHQVIGAFQKQLVAAEFYYPKILGPALKSTCGRP